MLSAIQSFEAKAARMKVMSVKRPRIAIIGGGISGLAAANRLLELSAARAVKPELTLIEARERAGGVINTLRSDDLLIETGPDAFISAKPWAVALAQRLGLEDRLIRTNPQHRRSFIVREGRLRPIPQGFHLLAPIRLWPFFASDIISWPGKARMALDLLLPRPRAKEDESLASFVRRRFGREALERIAQPLIGGIYTADPERLSLKATMPLLLEMEREHRSLILAMRKRGQANGAASGARYDLFISFQDGMQTIVERLVERLPQNAIRLRTEACGLRFDAPKQQWQIMTTRGTIFADAICLALPAPQAARVLGELDGELAADLRSITYASAATINLAYRRAAIRHPLDGFGFVVPAIERRAIIACTFSSVKFAGRAPEGVALLRAFVGGALQPEKLALDDDELLELTRHDLEELLAIESAPIFAHVARLPHSMPQYQLGHLDLIERVRRRLSAYPSLQLAGNAYEGVGIPDCIRSGESAAERILEYLSQQMGS